MEELEVTLEIDDLKYGKIKRGICNNKIVYIIGNEIIEDENVVQELEIKYGFKLSDDLKNIHF